MKMRDQSTLQSGFESLACASFGRRINHGFCFCVFFLENVSHVGSSFRFKAWRRDTVGTLGVLGGSVWLYLLGAVTMCLKDL